MRVALIIERMEPDRGGRETSTAQIAERLAHAGHFPTVLCGEGSWQCDGVEIRCLGTRGVSRQQRLKNLLESVAGEVGKSGFDVTHAMLPIPGTDIYQPRGGTVPAQALASRRRKGPVSGGVSDFFRQLDPTRRLVASNEKEVAADTSILCLAGSEMVAREFEDHYGRKENVRVVFNGVDVPDISDHRKGDWRSETREKLGCAGDETVFLTVGANPELKGVPEAVRAFGKWAGLGSMPEVRLVLVGFRDAGACEKMVRAQGLENVVSVLPHSGEIFKLYSAADCCLLLSWYDACSRVVLEATRWGLPSITTVCNGAAEALSSGAGLVVESPDDTDAVIAAMAEMTDAQARQKRSLACRQCASDLSMRRHVAELIGIYEQLAGGGGAV
jgi:glycosyltransferase involved in cell wall biosynthesis